MTLKIEVKHLYKVFGEQPEHALAMLAEEQSKDEIFRQTGHTVGVQDANLQIHEGEIFVIMGLSGSGKSTLVRLLNRLIEPSSGQVLVDGQDIAAMSRSELRQVRLKKISMVFQSFALMPHLSVLDNAAFGLALADVPLAERREKAVQALAQVGLAEHLNSYPDELSGGMQQRVGLARALAIDPDILLMDEAFSALDPLIRTGMQDELIALQAKHKRTIVFISHDLDEAMRIGDRIAIMQAGELVQVGTPDEILHQPANEYVRSFFRGVNVAQVFTAKDIARPSPAALTISSQASGSEVAVAIRQLQDVGHEYGYLVSPTGQFMGVVSMASLQAAGKGQQPLATAFLATPEPVSAKTPIGDIMAAVAKAPCGLPVVNAQGQYVGIVSKSCLLESLSREV